MGSTEKYTKGDKMRTSAEAVKEIRAREQEFLPELEKLRVQYPTLSDHDLLGMMYLAQRDEMQTLKDEVHQLEEQLHP